MLSFLHPQLCDPCVSSSIACEARSPGSVLNSRTVCEFSSIGPYEIRLMHLWKKCTYVCFSHDPNAQPGIFRKLKMVNDTQSFNQYKDKAHNISTDSIQRIIGSESYQPKLVQNWVDSIGQDIVNKLRV